MPESKKTYSGYVASVNDGEATCYVDMPLDEDEFPDWDKFFAKHGKEASPDTLILTAEHWMQEGTRLILTIERHPGDEPVLEPRP